MTQDLLEEVTDGVAVLTMNRPDRLNALSLPMLDAMLEALPRLAANDDVGIVVLTGAGRGFCAGGDVKAMAEGREARRRSSMRGRPWPSASSTAWCPTPTSKGRPVDLEAWHHSRTGETEDHREAARAFVDKREPLFKGR